MRLLPWVPVLLPAIASAIQQRQVSSTIAGIQIQIQAVIIEEADEYVAFTGDTLVLSADAQSAATFILQDTTGYLYVVADDSEIYPSGYAILTILPSVTSLGAITLIDSGYVQADLGTLYLPLQCTPTATGALNCANGILATLGLTNFAQCYLLNDVLSVFSLYQAYVSTCSRASTLINSLIYTKIANVGGGLGTGYVGSTSGGGTGVSPTSASAATRGSCSVTVMLYLASTTTYVPFGYIASVSAVGGGAIATNLAGGGCTPVTSTIRLASTAVQPPAAGIS